MAIHTLAYCQLPSATSMGSVPRSPIEAAPDQAVTLSSQRRPIFSQDMAIVAGFALGEVLDSAQIDAPTLRKIVSPYIVPTVASDEVPSDPNAMALLPSPWPIARQEEIGITATFSEFASPSDIVPQALLWVADRIEAAPQGPNYWIRYHNDDGTPIQLGQWTTLSVEFDQTLAAGTYAVIGFQHACDGLLSARLIFDKQVFRPGTIAVPLTEGGYYANQRAGARTHAMFYDGSLGVLGYFDSYAPPRIEVMALNSADVGTLGTAPHEGFLRIVRIDTSSGSAMVPSSRTYG